MAGTALRFALAIGLHLQKQDFSPHSEQSITAIQTWWSLYNLETLLSSMVGRPCMLSTDDVTTTLPSELFDDNYQKDTIWNPTIAFLDIQIRISALTRKVMSSLYNERRAPRLWTHVHASITALMAELDALGLRTTHLTSHEEPQSQWLQKQHYRLAILITRPSLRRIERCVETLPEAFTAFDLEAAISCVHMAQQVALLLPVEMQLAPLYEQGPWWLVVHCSTSFPPLPLLPLLFPTPHRSYIAQHNS